VKHSRLRVGLAAVLCVLLIKGLDASASAQVKPEGEMRWALYVTLSPAWFDPGEVVGGVLTPFWVLYALHDALVKPMPGNRLALSLAEFWTLSPDQKTYEFRAARGTKIPQWRSFHRRGCEIQLRACQG